MATVPPLPLRCTEPLICHVSCGWVAREHLSQTGNKAFLLSQGDRSAQVCLGGSGEGDGLLGPTPLQSCASPAGGLAPGLCLWEQGWDQKALESGCSSSGPLYIRGPSPSWGDWAMILEGPSRRGLPEHLCQVWHPGGCCAPPSPSWKHTVVCGTGRSLPCSGEARPS